MRAYLNGFGFWSPGFANATAWIRGEADPELERAEAALLEGPLRRRASGLTRMSVEVLEQATRAAGADLQRIPTIWATAHGEHATAIRLLKMMRKSEGKLSPTHFHNSVHNTPSAYASIAAGNTAASTTLTGGPELVGSALFEAFCLLQAGVREVAVVAADEPLEAPFGREDMRAPLALAFCLSADDRGEDSLALGLGREALAGTAPHERFGSLYVSAGLPLLEHAFERKPGRLAVECATSRSIASTTRHELDAKNAETPAIWYVDIEPQLGH